MVVRNGNETPNIHTVFPGIYEIDYVRFYEPSCADCLDYVLYADKDQLPANTHAENYIKTSENVQVYSGQTVNFYAPDIRLSSGFEAQAGSSFFAKAEECNLSGNSNSSIQLLSENSAELDPCTNPWFIVEAIGALFYECRIYIYDVLVYETSVFFISNFAEIWNTTEFEDGIFKIVLKLSNCSTGNTYTFNNINTRCRHNTKSKESNSVFDNDLNTQQTNSLSFEYADLLSSMNSSVVSEPEVFLCLFPNPNSGNFEIKTNIPVSDISNIQIYNSVGQQIFHQTDYAGEIIRLPQPCKGIFL